jgi:hypothetical protein
MSLREQLYDRRKDESVTSSPAFFPRFPGTTFAILSNVVAAGCNRSVLKQCGFIPSYYAPGAAAVATTGFVAGAVTAYGLN